MVYEVTERHYDNIIIFDPSDYTLLLVTTGVAIPKDLAESTPIFMYFWIRPLVFIFLIMSFSTNSCSLASLSLLEYSMAKSR